MSAKKAGDLRTAQMIADDYIDNYLFKLKDNEFYTKDNLQFVADFIGRTESKAYNLFSNQQEKINALLGEYSAQHSIITFIENKYLPRENSWLVTKPDWDAAEKIVTLKFGRLGKEAVYGRRMLYHNLLQDDWISYAKYYKLYFEFGLEHPRYHINNMTWPIFEHIDDSATLNFAVSVMKYSLETFDQNNYQAYDTYANLLYKTRMREEAIRWEERALKLSNQDKIIAETLNKMKKKEPTWKTSSN